MMKPSIGSLVLACSMILSCGSDEASPSTPTGGGGQGGAPDAGSDPLDIDFDPAAHVLSAVRMLAYETGTVIVDTPIGTDTETRKIDFTCGQSEPGTCPTVSATCEGATIKTLTATFSVEDSCLDDTGAPVAGVIVLTRNSLRNWTAAFQDFDRGGMILNGSMTASKSTSDPWQVSLNQLKLTGQVKGSVEDPSCTLPSCMPSKVSYDMVYNLEASTPKPLSVDPSLTAKTVTVLGTIAVKGDASGLVDMEATLPSGSKKVQSTDVNKTLSDVSVDLQSLVFQLPLACACPSSGSVITTSQTDCGNVTLAFSGGTASTCSSASVENATNSNLCSSIAKVTESTLQDLCR